MRFQFPLLQADITYTCTQYQTRRGYFSNKAASLSQHLVAATIIATVVGLVSVVALLSSGGACRDDRLPALPYLCLFFPYRRDGRRHPNCPHHPSFLLSSPITSSGWLPPLLATASMMVIL